MKTNIIYNKDCIEGMKELPDESVDCIITDPPYGISYSNCNKEIKFEKIHNDSELVWLSRFFLESNRVLKDNSNIYIFTSVKYLDKFLLEFKKFFNLENMLIIKQKHASGIYTQYRFRNSYEVVLFGSKGKRKLNKPKIFKNKSFGIDKRQKNEFKVFHNDFIDYLNSNEHNLNLKHPTQKSEKLMDFFIQLSSNKNEIVLDPFMGSGTTALACKKLNRQFIGYEIDPQYYKLSLERLSDKTSTSATPTLAEPKEFNKDLTATQQVASPKSASQTSLNPDIKCNPATQDLNPTNLQK